MNRLEDELKSAMRPEDPPEGFAERVIERLGELPERRPGFIDLVLAALTPPRIRIAALGTAFLIALVALAVYYAGRDVRRESPAPEKVIAERSVPDTQPPQTKVDSGKKVDGDAKIRVVRLGRPNKPRNAERIKKGEAAREQLLLALQIASTKLTEAREAVNHSLGGGRGSR